jgi:glycosyltransferase involved in cell wall biosynthesis
MLKHHIPFADEIIVNEGYSTDGSYEKIANLSSKIKVFRSHWDKKGLDWVVSFKDEARQRCSGDWCILLDCDEFIPEWEFERIREHLRNTSELMVPMRLMNFYGNYKVYHTDPEKVTWPAVKMTVHRNVPEVEVWGDGSNVRRKGTDLSWQGHPYFVPCHHFGFVRHGARLREKWRNMRGTLYNGKAPWLRLPSFIFNWLPHNWKDPQFLADLAVYDGPYISAVRNNPNEFVRDNFELCNYLANTRISSRTPE